MVLSSEIPISRKTSIFEPNLGLKRQNWSLKVSEPGKIVVATFDDKKLGFLVHNYWKKSQK